MIDKEKVEDFIKSLELDKDHDIVIFDPYMVHTQDLIDVKNAKGINLIRLRRPAWGQGNIYGHIMKLTFSEFKDLLETADDTR